MSESYFVRWWHDNPDKAEVIRARRRLKRREDPELAQAERDAAKARYVRRERSADRRGRGPSRPRVIWRDGQRHVYVGTGDVQVLLGVSLGTINKWGRLGVLPTSVRLTDERNRRWWPREFVEWLRTLLVDHCAGTIPDTTTLLSRVKKGCDNHEWRNHVERAEVADPGGHDDYGPADGEARR